jgi:hypothetical protein
MEKGPKTGVIYSATSDPAVYITPGLGPFCMAPSMEKGPKNGVI